MHFLVESEEGRSISPPCIPPLPRLLVPVSPVKIRGSGLVLLPPFHLSLLLSHPSPILMGLPHLGRPISLCQGATTLPTSQPRTLPRSPSSSSRAAEGRQPPNTVILGVSSSRALPSSSRHALPTHLLPTSHRKARPSTIHSPRFVSAEGVGGPGIAFALKIGRSFSALARGPVACHSPTSGAVKPGFLDDIARVNTLGCHGAGNHGLAIAARSIGIDGLRGILHGGKSRFRRAGGKKSLSWGSRSRVSACGE